MMMFRWAISALIVGAIGCNKDHGSAETHPPVAHAAQHAVAAHHHAGRPHWAYDGEGGPAQWGSLAPEFSTCSAGRMQTPIDLRSGSPKGRLLPIAFNYVPVPLALRNNGHTIQAENMTRSAIVTGNGRHDRYELVQYHFHSPSEHAIDGKLYDMEMHLVHKNSEGKLAVVGLMFRAGEENAILAPLWDNAPEEESKQLKRVGGVMIDLPSLVPDAGRYYNYTGSLTTPPCTEGVSWFVMADALEASEEQISHFTEITHGATNRPLQAANGRRVQQFAP